MSKLIRTNFDRHEMRRDRRYLAPAITVRVAGADHLLRDWSLSGFRPACGMRIERGRQIAGALRIGGADHPVRDWSLSGFRPACGMGIERGRQIAGALRIGASDNVHSFTAEAVRSDAQGAIGFRFLDCAPGMARALEKAVVARMAGRS